MLWPNNMQLLQTEGRIIRMPENDIDRVPLRAVDALVMSQNILRS